MNSINPEMMQQVGFMSFAEFAETMSPSSAFNKQAATIAGAEDIYSYSVYLNGELAKSLPAKLQEYHIKDVFLNSTTKEFGLNPESFRDNMRVFELAWLRQSYMETILEINRQGRDVSQLASDEYTLLSQKNVMHPYLVDQLSEQKMISSGLKGILEKASSIVGKPVVDQPPRSVAKGEIVSQDENYSIQKLQTGGVEIHENRRLNEVPKIGEHVTIVYYKGKGQVFGEMEKMHVSPPFIDEKTGELAVALLNEKNEATKVVMFNGVPSYAMFVGEYRLPEHLIVDAMNMREKNPKKEIQETVVRMPVSDIYIDKASGCLAIDYKEGGAVYSAVFSYNNNMLNVAKAYGMNADHVGKAKALQIQQLLVNDQALSESLSEIATDLKKIGIKEVGDQGVEGQIFSGPVVAESKLHIAQDMGRGKVQIYDKRSLDKLPSTGDSFTVKIGKDINRVDSLVRSKVRMNER